MVYSEAGSGAFTAVATELLSGEGGFATGAERELLSALLFDGVQSYLNYFNSGYAKRYREAFLWVTSSADTEYIFSFESCCEGLGIDPQGLRLGLINVTRTVENRCKIRRSRKKG